MSRNIIVCCDGTSNQPSKAATNVAKLTYTLEFDFEYRNTVVLRSRPGATRNLLFPMVEALSTSVESGSTQLSLLTVRSLV